MKWHLRLHQSLEYTSMVLLQYQGLRLAVAVAKAAQAQGSQLLIFWLTAIYAHYTYDTIHMMLHGAWAPAIQSETGALAPWHLKAGTASTAHMLLRKAAVMT